jgi:outer membrane protein TolC
MPSMKIFIRISLLSLIAVVIVQSIRAQNNAIITPDYCYKKALETYPLVQQGELYNRIHELQINTLKAGNLPQVSVNGQASYQSDVTELPIHLPNISIPAIDHDSYKATLDFSQVIYGGGSILEQAEVEDMNLKLNQQNLETELYKLKERINQYFVAILLIDESSKLNKLLRNDLSEKLSRLEAGVRNGITLQSNTDVMKAEIIKTEQRITESRYNREATIKMLSELISDTLSNEAVFELPDPLVNTSVFVNNRPEYRLFDIQLARFNSQKKLVSTRLNPRVTGFATLGYGRPGLNMLLNEFDTYYIFGAKLTWNLWNWNQTRNDRNILDLQSGIARTQKETYDKNVAVSIQQYIADISKYEQLIKSDQQIIELRVNITKSASSQLDNGIITSSDYLQELNAEMIAKLNLATHQVQLKQARLNYLAATGNL